MSWVYVDEDCRLTQAQWNTKRLVDDAQDKLREACGIFGEREELTEENLQYLEFAINKLKTAQEKFAKIMEA